jgi:glycosyltransferase involved in cell wall biosynthesis
MDVVFVGGIDPFYSEAGGTKSFVMNMLKGLHLKGNTPSLIGFTHTNNLTSKGNDFRFISVINSSGEISSYKFLFYLFVKAPLISIKKSSIIHVQREDHLLPFIFFFRKHLKLCTLHGNSAQKMYLKKGKIIGGLYTSIEKYALRHVDKIVAVDDSTKSYYIKKYEWLDGKIDVIPVGVDLRLFKPLSKNEMKQKYGLNFEKIVIFVGRHEQEKNLHFLLRSFQKISCQSCGLLMVGNGKEKGTLKKEAVDLNLNNIIFIDTVDHNVLPEILNCADVFALCSFFESGPLVVQEAIACGVPVVSTDVGRIREFVVDEHVGKIVDYDELEFANALDSFLSLNSNEISDFRSIAYKFSFQKTLDSYVELYDNIIEEGVDLQ